jgi:tetratricopeptide (TPR) repeat protein
MRKAAITILIMAAVIACAGRALAVQTASAPAKDYEAISLFGTKLNPAAADPAALERYDKAEADFALDPSEENTIWLGRRAAYLGRYREAIAVFSEGLSRFPDSYRLLRHRGHRYISVRQFLKAASDFKRAAPLVRSMPLEVEADGVPNKAGTPLSNAQFNVFYHLGLTYYLMGDWAHAEAAYRECLAWSKNDDTLAATTDWLYLTLRRAGRSEEATRVLTPIRPQMKIIENAAYYNRLLMYKGALSSAALLGPKPEESEAELKANAAIYNYGLAQRELWAGDKHAARARLEQIVGGGNWPAFACIAAEADLARLTLESADLSTPETTLRAWTASWNIYDLNVISALFLPGEGTTYFSSEKPGLITGRDALIAHHRGFGFVPGGEARDSRLWLEDIRTRIDGPGACVTARWMFDRDVSGASRAQRGPVTFVLVREEKTGAWRIAHAHFANDPPAN